MGYTDIQKSKNPFNESIHMQQEQQTVLKYTNK